MQPGDVESTFANTKNLQEWINFKPSTSIDIGIKNFIVKEESQRLGLNSFKALGAFYGMVKQLEKIRILILFVLLRMETTEDQ